MNLTIRRSSDNRYWNGTPGTTTSQWLTSPTNLLVSGTTAWSRVLTTASLQTGVSYTMVATATDGAGLTGTATSGFVYDTTNPTGTVTAPANGANVSGSVTVSSNSADSGGAGVASAVFEYRARCRPARGRRSVRTPRAPTASSWDTSSVADGQYYLHVITTDNAGNTVTSGATAVRVRVDNLAPTGDLTAPSDGVYVKGSSVTVSSNSADVGSGVANATFQRSPAGCRTPGPRSDRRTRRAPYSVTWNTTTLTRRLLRPAGRHDRQRG